MCIPETQTIRKKKENVDRKWNSVCSVCIPIQSE